MDKLVGEGKVHYGVGVLASVVVVAVIGESLSEAVVVIQHRCHAVEAETVEMVFLKPVLAVRQQEVQHLVFAIVEA